MYVFGKIVYIPIKEENKIYSVISIHIEEKNRI